jgi:hypothetical protein
MNLSEIKSKLTDVEELKFILPSGQAIPPHFHVTEVGKITKKFIDCGGTVREDNVINFQLWEDVDFDHRLGSKKLLDIIFLSEKMIGLADWEVEVEYQSDTIGKYGLEFEDDKFLLTNKLTDCLAKDKCGIPETKPILKMASLGTIMKNSCTPESGCC